MDTGSTDDSTYFRCKICRSGKIKLGNMGIAGVRRHAEDQREGKLSKHNMIMKSMKLQKSLEESTHKKATDQPKEKKEVKKKQSTIKTISKEMRKAEIYWALNKVYHHHSVRSASKVSQLFPTMSPDSAIAKEFGMSHTKLGYLINYGIAPYFHVKLMDELLPKGPRLQPRFSSCFDESLNKVCFSKQMDIHIIHFNEETKRVSCDYLGSQFMGHGTADDIMKDFQKAHKDLDIINNLVQLSMDVPNVYWAFLRKLKEFRTVTDPNAPALLDIGSCGLHIVHGACGTGQHKTSWDIAKNMSSSYSLFKKSPARRFDYLCANEKNDRLPHTVIASCFPMKFCAHRWLENGPVLQRFLDITDQLKIFLTKHKEEGKFPPKDDRFPLLLKNTSSNIFRAACSFSLSVARDIEPFLKLFQAERPLAPFLYEKLKDKKADDWILRILKICLHLIVLI